MLLRNCCLTSAWPQDKASPDLCATDEELMSVLFIPRPRQPSCLPGLVGLSWQAGVPCR